MPAENFGQRSLKFDRTIPWTHLLTGSERSFVPRFCGEGCLFGPNSTDRERTCVCQRPISRQSVGTLREVKHEQPESFWATGKRIDATTTTTMQWRNVVYSSMSPSTPFLLLSQTEAPPPACPNVRPTGTEHWPNKVDGKKKKVCPTGSEDQRLKSTVHHIWLLTTKIANQD